MNFELWLTFELWWGTNKQTNKQTDKHTHRDINTITLSGLRPGLSEKEGKIGNNVTAIIDFKKTKITVFKYERDKYNIYYTLCSWGCSTNTFVINSARVLLPLEVQCHIKIFFIMLYRTALLKPAPKLQGLAHHYTLLH